MLQMSSPLCMQSAFVVNQQTMSMLTCSNVECPYAQLTPPVCLFVQLQYQSYGTVHIVVGFPSSSERESSNQNNLQPAKLLSN